MERTCVSQIGVSTDRVPHRGAGKGYRVRLVSWISPYSSDVARSRGRTGSGQNNRPSGRKNAGGLQTGSRSTCQKFSLARSATVRATDVKNRRVPNQPRKTFPSAFPLASSSTSLSR
jgi:hypothetical protein